TLDPCCAVVPDFTLTSSVDPYSWTFTNTTTGATSYSWDFGDGGTSTETSPTHVYAGNGDYTVCLTATASCGEASICRNLDISVGMPEEAARQAGISLFPSPAADRITVQAPTAIATLQLIDAGGRITTMLPGAGASRLTLDVQQLPAGLYAVRVLLTNGALHHIRAVVAH
ncbi:MAG TPA: PKD domain-containing protein, partial [Flavobacteriales bacterium]